MLTHRQTVDGGTQKSWGKVGEKEKKKNRTCLQGRLKIKRNTIPACIWVGASLPLPPVGRVTGSKCGEDFAERCVWRQEPSFSAAAQRSCARFIVKV